MDILSFTYSKVGESPRRRFVAKVSEDSYYVNGYDLSDHQYKTFIKGNIRNISIVLVVSNYKNFRLVDKNELFNLLGYAAPERSLVQDFGITDDKLAQTLSNKLNRYVWSLGYDHFVVEDIKEVKIEIRNRTGKVYLTVKKDKLEFSTQNGETLTMEEFTQQVLS